MRESNPNQIPEWRYDKYAGRPTVEYKGGGHEMRESVLPERLYRQIPLEDLFILWRDKELPRQHFNGSVHSHVEKNSVGNFWFTEPMKINNDGAYIITEPKNWKNQPEHVQESEMSFKSAEKLREHGEWAKALPFLHLKQVHEVHTANRVGLDDLTVCVFDYAHKQLLRESYTLKTLDTEDPSSPAYKELLNRLRRINDCEFGNLKPDYSVSFDDQKKEENNRRVQIQERLLDPSYTKKLAEFYEWAIALPVIDHADSPEDMEYAAVDGSDYNQKRFKKFYESVRQARDKGGE